MKKSLKKRFNRNRECCTVIGKNGMRNWEKIVIFNGAVKCCPSKYK
jgi:hypothetical protein